MKRTSQTHPLEIDFIEALGGRIGMTSFPGIVERGVTASWERDFNVDIERLRVAGTDTLITLNEDHELEKFQLSRERFESGCEAHDISWHWLPIRDMSTPDNRFLERWPDLSESTRKSLVAAGTVVVHCKAGLGRTGMVVAQLLIDCGYEAGKAVQIVRAARPGTIETSQQLDYVMSLDASG